ncbi:OmpA family protein [Sorangium sp. So ce1014]|uniref:OmpA family protein n=1 Tax=Sorangium sp. So ce1014 TaxID=3133326 RepID=UPI003F5D704D
MKDRIRFERELELLLGSESEREQEQGQASWERALFKALWGGERRINTLLKIGRDAGGRDPKTLRSRVLSLLRVPFPNPAQAGGVDCEKNVRDLATASPDRPPILFTGRYESKRASGHRYFWAINQAGNTIIAIRTARGYMKKPEYWELRGDVQADGTAVLFQVDKPDKLWGYLQQQPDRTMRWHRGSYLGADKKRVLVDGGSEHDEVLQLSADNRPTMMMSLYTSDDNYLSVLLQQREWFPLTTPAADFVQEGARADVLRDLLTDYLKTPKGITYAEQQAKQTAAGRLVNYVEHLLWNGDAALRPDVVPSQPLKAHGEKARKVLPQGHHNNAVLAQHVAKMWLAHEKLNHAGEKRSFLDWLTKLAQERQETRLAKLLDVPLTLSRSAGKHQYRLKLEVASFGVVLQYAEGTLVVEKLSAPKWPGPRAYDVTFVGGTLKPKLPDRDVLFELVLATDQEWMPDDFEGTLWLGEVGVSAGNKWVKGGATGSGGYLRSRNGLTLAIDEDLDVSVGPGRGKSKKPKVKFGAELLVGSVRHKKNKLIDLATYFAASKNVTGHLTAAPHFCFGSSLLTPAARQLLRVTCADQLAALANPESQIFILGHTDRRDTIERNRTLSELRAKNVKTALEDILGTTLRVPPGRISAVGFGEWMAIAKLRPDQVKNREDRRVDLMINGALVATFHD